MFGKIKDKLKSVFDKNEEIIEEENNNKISENKEDEKPGFLKRVFGKSEEKEIEEIKKLEDEMLKEVSIEEKEAIKSNKEIPKKIIEKEKKKIEENIIKEEKIEKETILDISNNEEKSEGFFSKTFKKLKEKTITENDFENIWIDLEIFLLEINIAFEIVETIQEKLKKELIGKPFDRFKLNEKIKEVLSNEVKKVLISREDNLINKIKKLNENGEIAKIIMLGVNGTGKTTTIAKFVNYLQKEKLHVCVAASDTFRAAATEQLEEHSKKLNFKLIMHKGGSDPAAVAFDAVEHAKAKKLNVVLIDTAGRMPNNSNLMIELQKIKRVVKSQISIFVGDSISGNDLIDQINLFDKGINIDGIILTKVDTDERPGSIVTTAYSIEKPIYFIGTGQSYDDLIKFDAKLISTKLFDIQDDE